MFGVRNMLPFLKAEVRVLLLVIDSYVYSCMVFLRIVMLVVLILLKVLITLPPLDFPPLLVVGKVSYLPKEQSGSRVSIILMHLFPSCRRCFEHPTSLCFPSRYLDC